MLRGGIIKPSLMAFARKYNQDKMICHKKYTVEQDGKTIDAPATIKLSCSMWKGEWLNHVHPYLTKVMVQAKWCSFQDLDVEDDQSGKGSKGQNVSDGSFMEDDDNHALGSEVGQDVTAHPLWIFESSQSPRSKNVAQSFPK